MGLPTSRQRHGLDVEPLLRLIFNVERAECSKVAAFCLQQTFTLLGLQLDPGKSQVPSEVAHILGVEFNTYSLASQRCLSVQPKPLRKENFQTLVTNFLVKDFLLPTLGRQVWFPLQHTFR